MTDFGGSEFLGVAGVAIQTDGKIVAVGASDLGGDRDFALARYNPDGSLDASFDGDGKVMTDFGAFDDGGVLLGSVALLAVIAFWFPGALSTAQLRALYPIPLLRTLIEVAIGLSFLLAALSLGCASVRCWASPVSRSRSPRRCSAAATCRSRVTSISR